VTRPHRARRIGSAAALLLAALGLLTGLGGCASQAPKGYDYSAFRASRPASLLVLPPINDTPDIKAAPGVLSSVTRPLAEAGYYVLPVTLVDETFRGNGLTTANDIHELPVAKLHEIFGADAALYLRVTQYGASYRLLGGETRVTVQAHIVDLRSGQAIWAGAASASSQEGNGNQHGLLGAVVAGVARQIIGNLTDQSLDIAAVANQRLLGVPRPNGLLPGPRAPQRAGSD
jgi:hypothetical protein